MGTHRYDVASEHRGHRRDQIRPVDELGDVAERGNGHANLPRLAEGVLDDPANVARVRDHDVLVREVGSFAEARADLREARIVKAREALRRAAVRPNRAPPY